MKLFASIKSYAVVITALTVIIGGALSVNQNFAKSTDVAKLQSHDELLGERLDISIVDDQIFQVEQQIQQMQNYSIFEQRADPTPPTPMEEQALYFEQQRLEELKVEKKRRIESYEQAKQEK